MKHSIKSLSIYSVIIFFISSVLLLPSCSKDKNDDLVTYNSYVSHELVVTYTSSGIKQLFQNLSVLYPEVAPIVENVQYNVGVYNVTYKTMFQGEEIEASGLVCIPVSDNGSFPMISFQNGTNTAHDEAPTKDINNVLFKYLQSTSATGYIMLMPDYIGFGKSEQFVHPYLHKESTVLSVENLIIATKEMIDGKLVSVSWDNDLYLMGYSQGGWATMCTHKDITENTNLSFGIKASACGAGPYDLSVVQNFMFEGVTYPQPVYMAYSGVSYHSLGLITNPLSDYFNEPFATQLPSYFTGAFSNGEINDKLNDTVTVLVAESFLSGINTDPKYNDFRNAMNNNSVFGWNTIEPIRLYHGTSDNYVPPSTSELVYSEFEAAGAGSNVTYTPLPGLTHSTAAIPMILDALLWFNELEQKSGEIVMVN
ncbi:MAG: hypothetical protein HQ521_16490 [Bacteroidetes bacterium]|nr:hypothetical protein [Bacteroidota bacterium]